MLTAGPKESSDVFKAGFILHNFSKGDSLGLVHMSYFLSSLILALEGQTDALKSPIHS